MQGAQHANTHKYSYVMYATQNATVHHKHVNKVVAAFAIAVRKHLVRNDRGADMPELFAPHISFHTHTHTLT